jgi:elongation factor G
VDSKEVAFRAAGKGAFIDAIKKAKPALLEPIVNMVTIPAENVATCRRPVGQPRARIRAGLRRAGWRR